MKKFLSGIFCLAAFTTNAQYTATEDHTAAELLSEITGTGVTVLNPMLSCGDTTNGKYNGSGGLDFHNGIILSTGNISSTFPYVDGYPFYPEEKMSTTEGMDADVQAYWEGEGNIHTQLFNACILEFDVTTKSPGLTLDAIFASAEYGAAGYANMTGVGTCDIGGDVPFVLVKGGAEYPEYTQRLVYPETDVPVNSVSLYYDTTGIYASDCTPYLGAPYLGYYNYNGHPLPIPYPSINYFTFSKKIRLAIAVTPCDTYHVKMGVADSRSAEAHMGFSSALFVRTGSMTSVGQPDDCDITTTGNIAKKNTVLTVIPNPTNSYFSVTLSNENDTKKYDCVVADVLGRIVFRATGNLFEINRELKDLELITGNYILSLGDKNGRNFYQHKITKQ